MYLSPKLSKRTSYPTALEHGLLQFAKRNEIERNEMKICSLRNENLQFEKFGFLAQLQTEEQQRKKKTSRIPRNLNLVGETTLLGGIFCLEYPSRRSEKVNCHFLNYRLSFRKLQIVISQTADFHFANCRFSFCKLQSFISQTADFHFTNCRVSFRKLQIFISFRFVLFRSISFCKLALEHFVNHSLWFYRWMNNRMMEHSQANLNFQFSSS